MPLSGIEIDQLKIQIAGSVARRILDQKLGVYKVKIDVYDVSLYYHGRCRKATAFDTMRCLGVLKTWTSHQDYSYRHKPVFKYTGIVNPEWFEQMINGGYAVAPKFDKGSYKKDIEQYKRLSDFTPGELLYLCTHLDEYDCQETTDIRAHSYYCFYPKANVKDLSYAVYLTNLHKYIDRHFNLALKIIFDFEPKYINTSDLHLASNKFTDMDSWSETEIISRIETVTETVDYYKGLQAEMKHVQTLMNSIGGWDKFKEIIDEKFQDYLQENFALLITDEDLDSDLKTLLNWMLDNKHHGEISYRNTGLNPVEFELVEAR